jgi:hypothetical protein
VIRGEDAANRLRDLVLRAELENGTPLESSFQLFDQSGEIYTVDLKNDERNKSEKH